MDATEAARALRAIKSEKRSETSRANGSRNDGSKSTGRPRKFVEVADYNSADIRHNAAQIGATVMRYIGSGHSDGRDSNPNSKVMFFALIGANGNEWRVADTNGDPVWEEEDTQAFAELAEACGVILD